MAADFVPPAQGRVWFLEFRRQDYDVRSSGMPGGSEIQRKPRGRGRCTVCKAVGPVLA